MNSQNSNPQVQNLPKICSDLFSLAAYLRESRGLAQTDALYDGILSLFASMEKKARDSKITEVDIEKAKHAIVALIDETLQWESRLERKFFNTSVAGDEFFDRLDNMLENLRDSELPYDILEIYYICLTLGFGGGYITDPDRLRGYIRKLQNILNANTAGKLSPNGERPVETIQKRGTNIPLWVLIAFAAGAFLISVVVTIILKVQIADWAAGVINRIRSFLR